MGDDANLLDKYIEKREDFFRLTTNYQYIFEVTKCCGYGEWVTVHKDAPLSRLYENIQSQFWCLKPESLYVVDETDTKMAIPCHEECSFRKLITENSGFFRPIYPLPATAIYRVYYDQECSCANNCNEKQE